MYGVLTGRRIFLIDIGVESVKKKPSSPLSQYQCETSNIQRLESAFDDLDPRFFAKLVMMSSAPAKSQGDARYAPHYLWLMDRLSHIISTPICIKKRSAFFEQILTEFEVCTAS